MLKRVNGRLFYFAADSVSIRNGEGGRKYVSVDGREPVLIRGGKAAGGFAHEWWVLPANGREVCLRSFPKAIEYLVECGL